MSFSRPAWPLCCVLLVSGACRPAARTLAPSDPVQTEPPPPPPPPPPVDPDPIPDVPAWPALQTGAVEDMAISFSADVAPILYTLYSDVYEPGQMLIQGTWMDVILRQRGQGSREWPKHSWKTKLPSGVDVDGIHTRNFISEWSDAGYLGHLFDLDLMRGAGVQQPRTRYVTLAVNGDFQGVYLEMEDVDTTRFLESHGFDPAANIYRCGLRDCEMKMPGTPLEHYQGPWEKRTNTTLPSDDLDAFLTALNRTPEGDFEAWLAATMDLDRFVRYYAAQALMSLSGIDDSGSYLIHDLQRGLWSYVPWNLNHSKNMFWPINPAEWDAPVKYAIPTYTLYDAATIGIMQGKITRYGAPAHPPFQTLTQRVWDHPALRGRVLDEIAAMIDGYFSPAQSFPRIEAEQALIAADKARDPWVQAAYEARCIPFLENYVTGRIAFLRSQIEVERHRGEDGLVVNAVGPGVVEIYNRGAADRALDGLAITGDLRNRTQQPLPAGLVVPAHGKLALPFAVSDSGGEVGLFDATTLEPATPATYYGPTGGRTYGRVPDGSDTWDWRG